MPEDPEKDVNAARALIWRWLFKPGMERFELGRAGGSPCLRGTTVALADEGPVEIRYEVLCDPDWTTSRAEAVLRGPGGERRVLLVRERGIWVVNGREAEAVRKAHDVDLNWTPATNTLPIHRLGLRVGESSGILTAAWVRFPDLAVEPLEQEYTRLAENRYRYTSRSGAFTAELEVDGDGLVVTYGDLWTRETLGA